MTNAIKVENLFVDYGKYPVLEDVNFKIEQGEMVYIFGANGSGKSTLIKSILGINSPSKGSIEIFGKKNTPNNVSKYCGYVPQYSSIDRSFPISVREIIDLECSVGNTMCSQSPQSHLSVFGAEHLLDKKLDALSGGEFQKVMIARALTSDPEILIMDEPINNLDDGSQKELIKFIEELNEKFKKTILIISHDFNIIRHDSNNKILYVSQGHVREESEKTLLHNDDLNTQHVHTHEHY